MIRHAQGFEPSQWNEIRKYGLFSTKLYVLYNMYGCNGEPYDMWTIEKERALREPLGALGCLSGNFTLCTAQETDYNELAAFLTMRGAVTVTGDFGQIEKLASLLPGAMESACTLQLDKAFSPQNAPLEMCAAKKLDSVYNLLCRARATFQEEVPYPVWLTEMSHKRRHGFGEVYCLYVDNRVVSTASIVFQDEKNAIIGLVATDPACRGNGYGTALARFTARQAARGGRDVWVLAAHDVLSRFYEKAGFRANGRWGCLRMDNHAEMI